MRLRKKNVQLTLEPDFLVASSEVDGLEVVVVKDFGGPLGRKGRLGLKPVGLNPAKKPKYKAYNPCLLFGHFEKKLLQ